MTILNNELNCELRIGLIDELLNELWFELDNHFF